MRLRTLSSPHLHLNHSVGEVMQKLIIALIPGACALVWFFGVGIIINCVIAIMVAMLTEAVCLLLRQRSITTSLSDGSVLVTAMLLGLALPPTSPWWMTATGTAFAVLFGKHLYGGLGSNPFNPAMLGYVLLLISFPREMTAWLPPRELASVSLTQFDMAKGIFTGDFGFALDAITSATPLDSYRIQSSLELPETEIYQRSEFGRFGGYGWEWVNFGFLFGGLWLIHQRIIGWQIPFSLLGTLAICSLIANVVEPKLYLDVLTHLFSGATMIAAFFIATDPVTASTTVKGRLIYGASIGLLIFIIRTWGGYPDAVAFAVLLLNMAVPMIDHYTQPRVFGSSREIDE
ncbi:MAG TPA: electron transport complex subunit RsxD [Gammaproteobacteria bacterium]|nr:electron transport complex subunit RsxD [Gammaproteobacteria bacterium]